MKGGAGEGPVVVTGAAHTVGAATSPADVDDSHVIGCDSAARTDDVVVLRFELAAYNAAADRPHVDVVAPSANGDPEESLVFGGSNDCEGAKW